MSEIYDHASIMVSSPRFSEKSRVFYGTVIILEKDNDIYLLGIISKEYTDILKELQKL